ncbi:MAG: HNH endonuclease [Terriglobia bacterium]
MTEQNLSKEFRERISAVTSLRPKRVIDHILKHGFVTTEELRTEYGYDHAPRAARDVRECGIPLETFRVKRKSDGRSIGAYRFGDPSAVRDGFIGGRQAFSKAFKAALIEASGSRCQICLQQHKQRYLQIDHRVPYEVAGDLRFDEQNTQSYMLVCGSCNRAKSWSCEHCENSTKGKSPEVCGDCYWASPEDYRHVAMQDSRRLDLVWMGEEVEVHDELRSRAKIEKQPTPEYVKKILAQITSKK